jgi:hypothetical protein
MRGNDVVLPSLQADVQRALQLRLIFDDLPRVGNLDERPVRTGFITAGRVFRDLRCYLGVEVDVQDTREAEREDRDIGEFLAHAVLAVPPRLEELGDFTLQEADFGGHVAVETLCSLILVYETLRNADIHRLFIPALLLPCP